MNSSIMEEWRTPRLEDILIPLDMAQTNVPNGGKSNIYFKLESSKKEKSLYLETGYQRLSISPEQESSDEQSLNIKH